MKEELAEKEKKYAEMDANIEVADNVELSDEDDGEEDVRMREDEQYQKALDEQQEFEGKFNHCPILVIRSREDAYDQCKALGLSNEEANDIVVSANDERTLALYAPEIKRIFIFADKDFGGLSLYIT